MLLFSKHKVRNNDNALYDEGSTGWTVTVEGSLDLVIMVIMFAVAEVERKPSLVSFNYLAEQDTSYVSYKCAFLCMLGWGLWP